MQLPVAVFVRRSRRSCPTVIRRKCQLSPRWVEKPPAGHYRAADENARTCEVAIVLDEDDDDNDDDAFIRQLALKGKARQAAGSGFSFLLLLAKPMLVRFRLAGVG